MIRIRRSLLLAAFLVAIPAVALAQEAYTSRTANVRAGPDASYPVVAVLPPGAGLQVMGCIDDYSWCDAVFAGNRGWIYAGSLVSPYQGGRVPLLSYGATIGLPIVTFSIGSYWDRYYRGRPWYRNRSYWVSRPPPVHVRPPQYNRPGPRIDRPRASPAPVRRDRVEQQRKVYPPPVNNRPAARPDRRPTVVPGNRPGGHPEGARQDNGSRGAREPKGNGGNPPKRKDSEG